MADLTRKTANLLNSDQSTQGDGYVDNALLKDGNVIIDTTAFFVTEYIPVTEGTYYYYNNLFRTTIGYINYYNSNKIHLGNVQQFPIMSQGTYNLTALTIPSGIRYIRMSIDKQSTENGLYTEKVPSYIAYPYGWVHSLRKLTTATEAIENPLYSDGTAITAYTIKGNTTQSGTPSPQNPVMPQGTGDKTANLFDGQLQQGYYAYVTGDYTLADTYVCTHLIPCTENTTYTFRCINTGGGSKNYGYVFFDSAQNRIDSDYINVLTEGDVVTHTATTPPNTAFLAINVAYGRRQASVVHPSDITDFMLNTGSTAKPYEPFGYKIPISNGGVTTNIYLGSTPSERYISRMVITGTENWEDRPNYTYADRFVLQSTTIPRTSMEICTHFTVEYSSQQTYPYLWINNGEQIIINYSTKGTTTLAQFKQWLADQYTNGTPVVIYYVLATATTGVVNEPLMKIGDYVDTLSNATAIPTAEGANSITVDTTVQPSEFTATWTGWHDAYVKEKSENLLDVPYFIANMETNPLNANNKVLEYTLKPNTYYTLTSNFYLNYNACWFICLPDTAPSSVNNGVCVNSLVRTVQTGSDGKLWIWGRTVATPEGAKPIDEMGDSDWVMLNEGDTAQTYVPYWK